MTGLKVSTFIAAAACCFSAVDAKSLMSADFINGFETGIFVRDDENAFTDYSCEKPKMDKTLEKKS